MKGFNELKSIKDRVRSILSKREDSRDSDDLLISSFWYYECKLLIKGGLSAQDFLTMYSKGEITSSESIRRVRQKIQEEVVELRGKSYKQRKHVLEKEIRENIKDL